MLEKLTYPLDSVAPDRSYDDALVLMNTVSMLEDLGHEVRYAFSGCEALEAIRQEPVDLVVTDHAMPKMTGAELAAALKVEMPDLPVILATGYAERYNRDSIADISWVLCCLIYRVLLSMIFPGRYKCGVNRPAMYLNL